MGGKTLGEGGREDISKYLHPPNMKVSIAYETYALFYKYYIIHTIKLTKVGTNSPKTELKY